MPLPSLDSLRLAKRTPRRYHSLSDGEHRSRQSWDEEKDECSGDEADLDGESRSPSSDLVGSRSASGSQLSSRPMLKRRRRSNGKHIRGANYKVPRRILQGICYSIALIVVGFILFLVRMSYLSSKNLSHHKPILQPQWESFNFLTRYYGGVRTLVSMSEIVPEYPRSTDESLSSNSTVESARISVTQQLPSSKPFNGLGHDTESEEPVIDCFVDAGNTIRIPSIQHYNGRTYGFPENVMGSYGLLGLSEDVCYERYGRLGPYGYGYGMRLGGLGSGQFGDRAGADLVWQEIDKVDYRKVDWAEVQQRCLQSNAARFSSKLIDKAVGDGVSSKRTVYARSNTTETLSNSAARSSGLERTAFVVRTWDSYVYGAEDMLYLRALIAELALGSGAEYDIHLLVQVKNETAAIWADKTIYRDHLESVVPEEFWGIATLWSEAQSRMIYSGLVETWARGSDLPVHGAYRGLAMPLQQFAVNHPEYEYFWQWEMDARYTGHYYDLMKKSEVWAKAQPRKGLWERNSRYYVPTVHGSWEDFVHMVRVQTETGTENASKMWSGLDPNDASAAPPKGDKAIWGPERPAEASDHFEIDGDPQPPGPSSKDKYSWGVDEEADLITLNPIFDPEDTDWGLAKDITGYNETNGLPPRRAAIITASRMSRKLLQTMHRETAFAKHHAFPEMWPATTALHHGYKAVYVPHPMYVDRRWPVQYLAAVVNGGRNGATGSARTSVYGNREHNLLGSTWYYNAGFAGNLYKRWLGLKVDNEGGEQFETDGKGRVEVGATGVPAMMGGEGRMCLPPMLLHPVKGVEIPVEAKAFADEEAEFGPSD